MSCSAERILDGFDPEERARFIDLHVQGRVRIVPITYNELRQMYDKQQINWGEPQLDINSVRKTTLPLDSDEFSTKPITLVKIYGGSEQAYHVMNGNRRLFSSINPEETSSSLVLADYGQQAVPILVFEDSAAMSEFYGVRIDPSRRPRVVSPELRFREK